MKIATNWSQFIAEHGNRPGDQQGDVTVILVTPVEGNITSYTVPSGSVVLAAEAGNVAVVQIMLPGGRRMSVFPTNIAGFIDAAVE